MIEGLKPYTEYKESGQGWLGSVPAHWEVRRTKLLLREVDSRTKTGKEQLLRVSQYTGVTERKASNGSDEPDTRAASLVGYKRVGKHDLVVNIMLAWNGSLGVSKFEGIASPAYCVYRFKTGENPWYFHQLLRLPLYKGRIKTASTGVVESRLRLYSDDLGRIEAIVPPPDEQTVIVRFLDHANRKIDGFILAKRKLIALLGEQKQSIIHRAVTCGFNPGALLKSSGISWLGDIPSHWEVRKLKQCVTRLEQGWSPQCDSQPAALDEWGVLKAGCVNKDFFNEGQNKKLPRNLTPDPMLEVRDGDIMVSRANARELLGLAALAESPRPKLLLCDKLFRFRPRRNCFVPKFLVMALRAQPSRAQIESNTNGASSSMQNIGQPVLKNLWLSMPPIHEQTATVAQVVREMVPLNTAIARAEREISLMQEYRIRLTADVVTGKLDVREAAANLPHLPADADTSIQAEAADEVLEELELDEPAD